MKAGEIYGVYAPTKIAPTDPSGKLPFGGVPDAIREAAYREMSVDELKVLKKARDRIRELAAGETGDN